MSKTDNYTIGIFDVFISYYETEQTKNYAEIVQKILLSEFGLKAFAAHHKRNTYSHKFNNLMEAVIKNCKFFLFLNTKDALTRKRIWVEFKTAYPTGDTRKPPQLIILRFDSPDVSYSSEEFKKETNIDLDRIDFNQASFKNESQLIDVIKNVFNNAKYSPLLNKTKSKLLEDYLIHCISVFNKENRLDRKSLNEIFIENKTLLVDIDKWNSTEEEIAAHDYEEWDIKKFLSSNERYVLIGSAFGVGKTSYAYKITTDLAEMYMCKKNEWIPIYVPLQNRLKNIDDYGNNFETILSYITNKESKILFIFDALDEYGNVDEILELYNGQITDKINNYPNCKFLLTSRLNAGLPGAFNLNKYVRLFSFSEEQVNKFYEKYKIPLHYSDLLEAGLSIEESCKPLFCRMVALIYNEKKTIRLDPSLGSNRTLLYHQVIHNIVLGKGQEASIQYDYKKHSTNEKRVLRKISELKYILGDSLTVTRTLSCIKNILPEINVEFIAIFDKLISSYFYVKGTKDYEQRIDFIHKSFIEYLLAEFYLECCLNHQISKINMSALSLETVVFLEGLLSLFKSENNNICSSLIESFGIAYQTNQDVKDELLQLAESCFNDEKILIPEDNGDYPQLEKFLSYTNLQNHRLIGILILNKLGNNYKINNKKFFRLVRSMNNSILGNIITIENLDLSYSEIEQGFGNYNLSGANLSHSIFHGDFFGTQFIGADLSYSKIKPGTRFISVDFSGANLSNIWVDYPSEHSPFLVHFIDCDFSKCKMTNAVLEETSFRLSRFHTTDISGTKLRYADISLTNMSGIILDEKTDTSSINLLSKGYEFEWERIRNNKEMIRTILDDIDPHFDRKMKEKILSDNPEYS
jgi:uncharacterized protein YjbI with pentapeptide repeats